MLIYKPVTEIYLTDTFSRAYQTIKKGKNH